MLLRERLRWRSTREEDLDSPAGRSGMARTGVAFCLAGALLAPVGVLVPGDAVYDEPILAAACAGALVIAAILVLTYDRLPRAGFHALAAVGSGLASLGAYGWGTESAFGPLAYVWVTLFVFYYFPFREALPHLGLMLAGYAVALAVESPPENPIDGWLATAVTISVTGICVAAVRDRLGRLIEGLSDVAHHDPLTSLLNRRGFEQAFDVELERARRSDARLSVLVCDLDRFGRVNDEGGRAAGDSALRDVARAIGEAKRGFDSVARVGGEEFALLVPDCDEHGAYMLAERVRTAIAGDTVAGLTASFGVATYPIHGGSCDSLLRAADQALQAAKRLGRNRSVISSAEVAGILERAARAGDSTQVGLASLLALAEGLDRRESGSATHCQRVGRLAELTARELGLSPESVERVRLAGILHDVGRVALPDELVSKDGPLTDDEWALVRSHPEVGARMVGMTDHEDIRSWILLHHERPDGYGYPEGRAEREVPVEAAIVGVADAYEALTSPRPYRPALSPEDAAGVLRDEAGRQFRRDVVDALLRAV